MDAVLAELRLRARPDARLRSIYLGGGTPSLLGPDAVATILAAVRDSFAVEPDAEVTLEANPGPDERGDARHWCEAGITRISFGAQSMDPAELRGLGRRHGPDDVAAAVADARSAGIASINVDLLYDVPGQSEASWGATLDSALALGADHLSLYALTLDDEGGTGTGADHLPVARGARRWRERARAGQDEDRAAEQYALAEDRLAAAGYRHYEISNWARPGHESRHNLGYWERRPFEAVGPGAHAFDGTTRRWNDAAFDPWLEALRAGRLPPGGAETLEEPRVASERLILGLRLDAGVLAVPHPPPALAWGLEAGLLEMVGDRIRLTQRGRLLSNEVFARLL